MSSAKKEKTQIHRVKAYPIDASLTKGEGIPPLNVKIVHVEEAIS